MNEMQLWASIEQMFKDMMKLCDDIVRQCEGDMVSHLRMPISPDEAKRLLEDAKEYLRTGEAK